MASVKIILEDYGWQSAAVYQLAQIIYPPTTTATLSHESIPAAIDYVTTEFPRPKGRTKYDEFAGNDTCTVDGCEQSWNVFCAWITADSISNR